MERYAVEGSTVLGWTITVDAPGPGAAIQEAQRIASRIDLPAGGLCVRAVDHRVVRCDDAAATDERTGLFVEIW
ncbi:MAG TPA: hypothetical protein VMT70_22015 [Vicinamibacteria bacterium]|nr:hypothetical protein [Vicinamibacteria bacterium]